MTSSRLGRAPRKRIRHLLTLCFALVASAAFVTPSAFAVTGSYTVKWSEPSDLRNHTVYSPVVNPAGKMPVLIWGEGACFANGLIYKAFLSEITSHGVLVIASGGPYQAGTTNVGSMDLSLAWAKAQNAKAGGPYQGKLDVDHVAVAGHSCGGLEAYQFAAKHSEVGAVGIMNSGQLSVSQAQLDAIKAPILYVLGGSYDVAYANGVRDYNHLKPSIPSVLAVDSLGHFGTYFNTNGGMYAQVLTNWILWRVGGSSAARETFLGGCTLCSAPGWTVQSRNIS